MPYDSLMSVYGTLLNAGGILFGIFGLWVGVLYPGILEKSSDPNKYKNSASQSNDLLKPLFVSSFLFFVMLFVSFFAPFMKEAHLSSNEKMIIKGFSAGVAAGVFVVLLCEIVSSMSQVDCFQRIILRNETKTDMKKRVMSGPCISDSKSNDEGQNIE